ncbi:MAG: hypothetical protein Q8M15_08575 [Bacteroidota bacterium]|nr:hypothetical protein [Bacteroidota bacterium]
MTKKILIVISVIGLIQLIIIACCPDPKTYYNRITGIEVENCSLKTDLGDSVVLSQNDFRIRLRIMKETFAQIFNPSALINSAYATSCEDNFVGLKSDIIYFTITCNKEILNTQAGVPIDYNKLNVYKIGFTEDSKNQRKTINEWLDILNNGGYLLAFEWYFEFNQNINPNGFLKFKINIKQEDGTEFEVETNSIKIK